MKNEKISPYQYEVQTRPPLGRTDKKAWIPSQLQIV